MTDEQHSELMSTMRELIQCLNHQSMLQAQLALSQHQCSPSPCSPSHHHPSDHQSPQVDDGSVSLQFGHSAGRYNEAMGQIAADKQLAFLERQQDRWQIMFQQLRKVTE